MVAQMASELPLRKYIKVWIKKRANNTRNNGTKTFSYTLEWVEYGRRNFMSLGVGATAGYARQAAAIKEKELNSFSEHGNLVPVTWGDLEKKYLDTMYPGYGLPLPNGRNPPRSGAKASNRCMPRKPP